MSASSQTPTGAPPPNSTYDPAPLQAAVASYTAVVPAPAGPAPVSSLQAATGVITAAMEQGHTAPAEIADAEEAAGILFDPQRAEDIATAAYKQAKAEDAAELAKAQQDREAREWFHTRQRAVAQLCEGRPLDYYVAVGEVLAALDGRTPTTAPLTITWDGMVMGPSGDTEGENTLVPCTTARGGRAALVLDEEKRQELAALLDLRVRDIRTPCATASCGTDNDLDASDPALFGWSRLEVASLGGVSRWYCSDMCVFDALARAGHELAADDRRAELDGGL